MVYVSCFLILFTLLSDFGLHSFIIFYHSLPKMGIFTPRIRIYEQAAIVPFEMQYLSLGRQMVGSSLEMTARTYSELSDSQMREALWEKLRKPLRKRISNVATFYGANLAIILEQEEKSCFGTSERRTATYSYTNRVEHYYVRCGELIVRAQVELGRIAKVELELIENKPIRQKREIEVPVLLEEF